MIVVLISSKPLVLPPSALERRRDHLGVQPRHARRPRDRRAGARARSSRAAGCRSRSPRHVGQQPTYYNQVRGQHGDRYADLTQGPPFAFGEGLTLHDRRVRGPALDATERDRRRHRARRGHAAPTPATGRRWRPCRSTSATSSPRVTWADKELKTYRQVTVPRRASRRTSTLELPVAACTIVDAAGARVVEPGDVRAAGRPVLARRGPAAGRLHRQPAGPPAGLTPLPLR